MPVRRGIGFIGLGLGYLVLLRLASFVSLLSALGIGVGEERAIESRLHCGLILRALTSRVGIGVQDRNGRNGRFLI